MCSSTPQPESPPAPTPVRDLKIDAMRERQVASRRASASGYSATMLTGPGGVSEDATTSSSVLGA